MNYWGNPSYGEENKGIYSKISYSDVDFYLLDDRFFRDADEKPDSINGLPNPNKRMLGEKQLQWLENEILTSYATFKIILVGSQVLNPISKSDCLRHYPQDFNELLRIISQNKINGVLFFSGDRHQSEIIKHDRLGTYSLYDVTVSPYSAGTHKFSKLEANNPARIIGIDEKQNFGKVSVTGERKNRILKVEFIGLRGEKLGEWSVNEKELKF
jgi:alkaline phosphatase D